MRHKFRERVSTRDQRLLNCFRLNPPQSIRKLAEQIGVGVIEIDLDDGHHGYLDRRPELGTRTGYVVFINKSLDNDEKRWALAHELGHYFLHRDRREVTFDAEIHLKKDGYSYWLLEEEEQDAENFAEDLFFSGGALEAFISLHGIDASLLAKEVFGVPVQKVTRAIEFYRKFRGLRIEPSARA